MSVTMTVTGVGVPQPDIPLYVPDPIFLDMGPTESYLLRELEKVQTQFDLAVAKTILFLGTPPERIYEGLTVGANGTTWDPGSGKGIYTFYDGGWKKLG